MYERKKILSEDNGIINDQIVFKHDQVDNKILTKNGKDERYFDVLSVERRLIGSGYVFRYNISVPSSINLDRVIFSPKTGLDVHFDGIDDEKIEIKMVDQKLMYYVIRATAKDKLLEEKVIKLMGECLEMVRGNFLSKFDKNNNNLKSGVVREFSTKKNIIIKKKQYENHSFLDNLLVVSIFIYLSGGFDILNRSIVFCDIYTINNMVNKLEECIKYISMYMLDIWTSISYFESRMGEKGTISDMGWWNDSQSSSSASSSNDNKFIINSISKDMSFYVIMEWIKNISNDFCYDHERNVKRVTMENIKVIEELHIFFSKVQYKRKNRWKSLSSSSYQTELKGVYDKIERDKTKNLSIIKCMGDIMDKVSVDIYEVYSQWEMEIQQLENIDNGNDNVKDIKSIKKDIKNNMGISKELSMKMYDSYKMEKMLGIDPVSDFKLSYISSDQGKKITKHLTFKRSGSSGSFFDETNVFKPLDFSKVKNVHNDTDNNNIDNRSISCDGTIKGFLGFMHNFIMRLYRRNSAILGDSSINKEDLSMRFWVGLFHNEMSSSNDVLNSIRSEKVVNMDELEKIICCDKDEKFDIVNKYDSVSKLLEKLEVSIMLTTIIEKSIVITKLKELQVDNKSRIYGKVWKKNDFIYMMILMINLVIDDIVYKRHEKSVKYLYEQINNITKRVNKDNSHIDMGDYPKKDFSSEIENFLLEGYSIENVIQFQFIYLILMYDQLSEYMKDPKVIETTRSDKKRCEGLLNYEIDPYMTLDTIGSINKLRFDIFNQDQNKFLSLNRLFEDIYGKMIGTEKHISNKVVEIVKENINIGNNGVANILNKLIDFSAEYMPLNIQNNMSGTGLNHYVNTAGNHMKSLSIIEKVPENVLENMKSYGSDAKDKSLSFSLLKNIVESLKNNKKLEKGKIVIDNGEDKNSETIFEDLTIDSIVIPRSNDGDDKRSIRKVMVEFFLEEICIGFGMKKLRCMSEKFSMVYNFKEDILSLYIGCIDSIKAETKKISGDDKDEESSKSLPSSSSSSTQVNTNDNKINNFSILPDIKLSDINITLFLRNEVSRSSQTTQNKNKMDIIMKKNNKSSSSSSSSSSSGSDEEKYDDDGDTKNMKICALRKGGEQWTITNKKDVLGFRHYDKSNNNNTTYSSTWSWIKKSKEIIALIKKHDQSIEYMVELIVGSNDDKWKFIPNEIESHEIEFIDFDKKSSNAHFMFTQGLDIIKPTDIESTLIKFNSVGRKNTIGKYKKNNYRYFCINGKMIRSNDKKNNLNSKLIIKFCFTEPSLNSNNKKKSHMSIENIFIVVCEN